MFTAYYNGSYADESEIRIPLNDRSLFFGDGIYDAAIGKDGNIYLEDRHIERFLRNSKRLSIPLKMGKEELSRVLHTVVEKSGLREFFIYFQLSRLSPERVHAYPDGSSSALLVTVKPYALPPSDKKLKVITETDIRHEMCDVKTLNLLPSVLASKKAQILDCDEAVFIRNGYVTECAHSNIFAVKDSVLFTHPADRYILPGVTRARVIELAKKLGTEVREIAFTRKELTDADCVLISSTTKLCLQVESIDGMQVGEKENQLGKEIIMALRRDFFYNLSQNN